MNYTQAQLKYRLAIAAGALLFTGALISTVFSTLKMLHWRLDSYTTAAATINRPIKNFMFTVYENTRPLDWFWDNSPTPDFIRLSNPPHWKFLVIYLLIFIGAALFTWGRTLMRKVEAVEPLIQARLNAPAEEGVAVMTLQQLEESTPVEAVPSFFSQVRMLCVLPVGIGVVYLGGLWVLRIL
ncbi:YniB family protein [Pseudomonas chlororaphis]|uniref:YniB family protein n=1 Tax=Pseudomonas chlororaphis TaxID=587753 RepID=UPI002365F452|nr:YniB family protein [Pseudomonas chlororaphis]WDG53928.1 YniB family protein [Pseudomonas chlororaphis]WDH90610.1 YniB family protein [Pseudomonas chlororaphis]